MKSIAFFNNKGGVGKTTLLCNLAAQLALYDHKSVLIIDADPQCNATQNIFDETKIEKIYSSSSSFTVHSIIKPLQQGKGYAENIIPEKAPSFGIDIIPGDPRLSLTEDVLAGDWKDATAGSLRGLRTTFLFREMLSKCENYDYVFFDMGPSLGAINRAILIACDYFISPMSIDIFSVKAIENISLSISSWKKDLTHGLARAAENDDIKNELGDTDFKLKFLGYVTQQYTAKTGADGKKRAVNAYEKIMGKIPKIIIKELVEKLQSNDANLNYELGSIPNLHSLIPLSQSSRKPIFELKSKDGVVGAHFTKVSEAHDIFANISKNVFINAEALN